MKNVICILAFRFAKQLHNRKDVAYSMKPGKKSLKEPPEGLEPSTC